MSEATHTREINITAELGVLETKKKALQKVMQVARMVEQIRFGLEAAVLLGKPATHISKQVLQTYTTLADKVKHLPTPQIKDGVHKHEAIVNQNINTIMEIARPENHEVLQNEIDREGEDLKIEQLINSYRISSQTCVAL
ncbi:hypothetical protein, partial [Kaarinaea lacus]